MTSAAPFGRLLTAMATAFTDDGEVDLEGTAAIAVHLLDHGHDGVVVSGTTGESPTTTVAEDGRILQAVKDAVGDRGTVIAGVGTNATAHSVELAEQAAKIGVDGLLLVTPYYNKPSQAGVLHHFRSVAEATDVPVMLYDVPGRTGHHDLARDLRARPRARRRSPASRTPSATWPAPRAWSQLGYAVYCGDDANTLGILSSGGCGLVSVVGHAAGDELKADDRRLPRGRHRRRPRDVHPARCRPSTPSWASPTTEPRPPRLRCSCSACSTTGTCEDRSFRSTTTRSRHCVPGSPRPT